MSKHGGDSLIKVATLSTVVWSIEVLKTWGWDSRKLESLMQSFIVHNQKNFSYLGITVSVVEHNNQPALQLTTSQFVGAIPMFSPMSGTPFADLAVTGRFGENVSDIISLLDDTIQPEYSEWNLSQESQMSPPIYLECCKYLDAYQQAERRQWRKFDNVITQDALPSSSTLWGEYARRTAVNPWEASTFKNKKNILTTNHPEWNQLNYVLQLALGELESFKVPVKTRVLYTEQINRLKVKLKSASTEFTKLVRQHASDPIYIKDLKVLANKILRHIQFEQVAWRMNYSEFFERYVQYIFDNAARKKGVDNLSNPQYRIKNLAGRPAWGLSYLEPDMVLHHSEKQIVVDAKYKSHMFNWENGTDELKDSFRRDLHQVLAYTSFSTSMDKEAMLVYPYTEFIARQMKIKNPFTHVENTVYLVGIPIDRNQIFEIEENIGKIILFGD